MSRMRANAFSERVLSISTVFGAAKNINNTAVVANSKKDPDDDPDGLVADFARQFNDPKVQYNLVIDTQPDLSHKVFAAAKKLSTSSVLLDNQATKGVFGNPHLLSDVKRANVPMTFTGVGGTIKSDVVGYFKPLSMWVYVAKGLGFNVLSFSEVEAIHRIEYERKRAFHVFTDGTTFSFFKRCTGLWACEFNVHTVTVNTVQ